MAQCLTSSDGNRNRCCIARNREICSARRKYSNIRNIDAHDVERPLARWILLDNERVRLCVSSSVSRRVRADRALATKWNFWNYISFRNCWHAPIHSCHSRALRWQTIMPTAGGRTHLEKLLSAIYMRNTKGHSTHTHNFLSVSFETLHLWPRYLRFYRLGKYNSQIHKRKCQFST